MFWLGLLAGWIASGLVVAWATGRWFRWLREKNEAAIDSGYNAHEQ